MVTALSCMEVEFDFKGVVGVEKMTCKKPYIYIRYMAVGMQGFTDLVYKDKDKTLSLPPPQISKPPPLIILSISKISMT